MNPQERRGPLRQTPRRSPCCTYGSKCMAWHGTLPKPSRAPKTRATALCAGIPVGTCQLSEDFPAPHRLLLAPRPYLRGLLLVKVSFDGVLCLPCKTLFTAIPRSTTRWDTKWPNGCVLPRQVLVLLLDCCFADPRHQTRRGAQRKDAGRNGNCVLPPHGEPPRVAVLIFCCCTARCCWHYHRRRPIRLRTDSSWRRTATVAMPTRGGDQLQRMIDGALHPRRRQWGRSSVTTAWSWARG